jgi:choline kinase/thiamine kinase-like enzyme
VSTPQVDDVVRIDDDTNRPDGKIVDEHKTPAILILTAGLGSRLHSLTEYTNKALLPINNKAILTHIIESFPVEYDIIIALGYKGDVIREYCQISHPDRKITFVEIDDYTSEKSGPGYSTLQTKKYLDRPFYAVMGDCLIQDKIPALDTNWLGVDTTSFPEKYSTLHCDANNNITDFKNKSKEGFQHAFIGIAAIKDHEIFWDELEKNSGDGEFVSAFKNPDAYPTLKAKKLNWFDTGNFDDYMKAKKYLDGEQLCLNKDNKQIVYKVSNKFIKFISEPEVLGSLKLRHTHLKNITPNDISFSNYFLTYPWIEGNNLYHDINENVFGKFLKFLNGNIKEERKITPEEVDLFYRNKTNSRVKSFISKFGQNYYTNAWTINGTMYPSMQEVLDKLSFTDLLNNPMYEKFHGDLHFANLVKTTDDNFIYIDWRTEFAGRTDLGDVYYDLAKLLGGIIIPYDEMKNDKQIQYRENSNSVNFKIPQGPDLLTQYENWLQCNNYPHSTIKFLTAIIFLNMSPLHEENFAKLLWFKSLELLHEYNSLY